MKLASPSPSLPFSLAADLWTNGISFTSGSEVRRLVLVARGAVEAERFVDEELARHGVSGHYCAHVRSVRLGERER